MFKGITIVILYIACILGFFVSLSQAIEKPYKLSHRIISYVICFIFIASLAILGGVIPLG